MFFFIYMNINDLLKKSSLTSNTSKYDYKTISTKADQIYNTLLYREMYPNIDRKECYKELLDYIEYFRRLPNARKITRLQYLSKLFNLYLGNLALCDGSFAEAIEYYLKAVSVRDIQKKISDIGSKKCSRIELCDLMPLVYNVELMLRLCGLNNKADSYMIQLNQALYMWEEHMGEIKPNGFSFPALKDSMLFTKSGYEFCCEEYYDKWTGRNNFRFNTGLDEIDIIVPEIIKKDNKEYIKLGLCSDLIEKDKLLNIESAKIISTIREFWLWNINYLFLI